MPPAHRTLLRLGLKVGKVGERSVVPKLQPLLPFTDFTDLTDLESQKVKAE